MAHSVTSKSDSEHDKSEGRVLNLSSWFAEPMALAYPVIEDEDKPIKDDGKKYYRFRLTIWDQQGIDNLLKMNYKYFIVGRERCPTTDRPHFQCFIYMKNQVYFSSINKALQKGNECIGWVKSCHASNLHNINYCKKDRDFDEYGTPPNDDGKHNLIEKLGEFSNLEEFMENEPETYCKWRNGVKDLWAIKQASKRFWQPIVVRWIAGPSGSNKTREAFEAGCVPVVYNNGYFSDWGGARKIVFEEFRGQIPYGEILKITDDYHNYYTVNIKGSQKMIDLDEVWFTSPLLPEEAYPGMTGKDNLSQLKRRIGDNIINKWSGTAGGRTPLQTREIAICEVNSNFANLNKTYEIRNEE